MADGIAFSGCGDERESLLPRKSSYQRSFSHAADELKSFRSCLRWLCIDHSDSFHAAISWFVFFIFSFAVPLASHFIMSYSPSRRAYDSVVQLALSGSAALSYLSLSTFVRRHGLRRFLFLDKLRLESERVRLGYTNQLNRSFRILSVFVLPCFAGEVVYKLAWYLSGEERVPPGLFFMGNAVLAESVFAFLELASWIYRTAIFFVVCVLFRLMCYLQILRLEDFAGAFSDGANVACILRAHLRIRRELRIISHRYRIFNVYCVVIVTVSQFVTLLVTTRPSAVVNFFNAGEIALCSIGLVTGLLMCLRSAAKITHKAQAITSLAATWHVSATIDSYGEDSEVPSPETSVFVNEAGEEESEHQDSDEDDELEDAKLVSSNIHTFSFQKRQSLVTYMENNRAGITLFGFVVDRTWLHALFMIEFSLVMWLLGKTVGIS
ncbi:uncharacterized protein LOC110106869 [Dendrobium catenatum]|uniref:Uncharacterized protein n=1 Tax=Dendrobium catenatum TaxID=906689 RepID=A0A2I0VIU8_9ASPA|nr:uncharacterized protein LOC110106869 [Dendrobium catenatum]PKU63342.1 hypothetical protein MA16_Dca013386 [Dendrobium catenatum]